MKTKTYLKMKGGWFKRNPFIFFIHFVAGMLTVFSVYVSLILPLILLLIFVAYECAEDKYLHDKSFIDLWAYMIGIYIATLIVLILI